MVRDLTTGTVILALLVCPALAQDLGAGEAAFRLARLNTTYA